MDAGKEKNETGADEPEAPPVRVAAAVLLRGKTENVYGGARKFLLARRPQGKVYAGWWEFPGGKLETGENFHDALVRELDEELNITVECATPWFNREFVYPHARVHLRFFRVTRWARKDSGGTELTAHEHDAIAWLDSDTAFNAPDVSPILPANGPILKALTLPQCYAITDATAHGHRNELEHLENALTGGLKMIQVRDKTLPPQERLMFLCAVCDLAKKYGALTLLNVNGDDDLRLAQQALTDGAELAGVHLSAAALRTTHERPGFAWVGASCHDAAELEYAAQLQLDFAVLGPVLPTPTHPHHPGIGWETFATLAEAAKLPVLALGGMRLELANTAQTHGAHGIALLRGWRNGMQP